MTAIGIDLGTTNTVAAIGREPFDLALDGSKTLPSVVAYPPTGITLVGQAARRRKAIDPANTLYAAKRLIGRHWLSSDRREFERRYPHELVENDKGTAFKTRRGLITPVQVGQAVLDSVAARAPVPFDRLEAVIAVPSVFGRDERQATIDAGKAAGLASVRVVDEPLAAARAYLAAIEERPRRAVVVDFGGGTFDVAVVDCSGAKMDVLAYRGDLYLGGDDVDYALANWVADELLKDANWDVRTNSAVFARLVAECERAKIRLGESAKTTVDISQVDPGAPLEYQHRTLTAQVLEERAQEVIRRTFALCDETMSAAKCSTSELEMVFAAGGATLLKPIRDGIEGYFGLQIQYPFNPLQIVAIGASLY